MKNNISNMEPAGFNDPDRGRKSLSAAQARREILLKKLMESRLKSWQGESENMSRENPELNMEKETENPELLRLMGASVPLKEALEVSNWRKNKDSFEKEALARAEKKVLDNIRARGARAPENGVSAQSGITVRPDVSRMTPAQRAEIARRALNGEKVKL